MAILLGVKDEVSWIPTVKFEIPGKSIFEMRNQNFYYIQVIVFDRDYTSGSDWDLASTLLWKNCDTTAYFIFDCK